MSRKRRSQITAASGADADDDDRAYDTAFTQRWVAWRTLHPVRASGGVIQQDNILPLAEPGIGRKPLERVVRHLSFAKQLFDSTAGPVGKIALMLLPVATLLAYISSDVRHDTEMRGRAVTLLKKLDTKFCMAVAVSADWGIICEWFLRLFDVASHDIAQSRSQIDCMVETLESVFIEGRVFQQIMRAASGDILAASGADEPLPSVGAQGETPGFITTTVMANLRHKYVFLAGGQPVLQWGEPRGAHKAEFSRFATPADP